MYLYISEIKPFLTQKGIELATKERQARVKAFLREEDRARCLVAGLLLRAFCGVTDDSMLIKGPKGKPYLRDGGYFNLSHSGDYVVLAASGNEVGADIEKVAPYPKAVAGRCFTLEEQEWLNGQRGDGAFYRLWTAKEAAMKATGLGFSLSPGSFSVLPMDGSPREILGRRWFFSWYELNGHIVSCAVENSPETTGLIQVPPEALLE